ncbi:hypothetical protein [Corynebacterium lipophiloflavum]|uniref:DUF3168 domain-containing protein n=1 Tax=Corynebacterium lipophiloflavum (strain ATCC 700352 / DSM 44291 / CCUG 37336 / JCM 10383 / DMMZ 1944) TaxID=525263 RepID=C0XU13_CORLD|nr:hypothetical protein [Corynebacterium lipophiloflavum]EEI16275.1 hypothetical protein HMPREF0298_1933 [Corynebacterium lipophiloflavum DSM 44291]
MNEVGELDILRKAIRVVQGVLGPDVWVADSLPKADDLEANLPAVVVDLLPGSEVAAWGGETITALVDYVTLDVEVVDSSRAKATEVGVKVRRALHQLPFIEGTGVKDVDCPRLSTREEINHRVKVIGTVVDLAVTGP